MLTSNQEKIARFVANSHVRQRADSDYFAVDGGISLAKVALGVGLSESTVLTEAQAMDTADQIEMTTRSTGPGLRAIAQTFTEIAAIDAANAIAAAAAEVAARRPAADSIKDSVEAEGIQWRAFALMTLGEINSLRQWLASFKTEVAAATNLADLKTRVASLPAMADRTIAQAKTAYANKINDGSAD